MEWNDRPEGGSYNIDPSEPTVIPESCIKLYQEAKTFYLHYLETPEQVLKYGSRKQKGLVKCIHRVIMESNDTTSQDVHKHHKYAKCKYSCDGFKLDCPNYKFLSSQLEELRRYNESIRS